MLVWSVSSDAIGPPLPRTRPGFFRVFFFVFLPEAMEEKKKEGKKKKNRRRGRKGNSSCLPARPDNRERKEGEREGGWERGREGERERQRGVLEDPLLATAA